MKQNGTYLILCWLDVLYSYSDDNGKRWEYLKIKLPKPEFQE